MQHHYNMRYMKNELVVNKLHHMSNRTYVQKATLTISNSKVIIYAITTILLLLIVHRVL